MSQRISYLNGQFLPHENCFVHIEDRGFQFADGAYEVTLFDKNRLIDGDAHLERLLFSLGELKIQHNFAKEELKQMQINLFAANQMDSGTCYLQITRGFHSRIPNCPKDITSTICATVSPRKSVSDEEFERGFSVMTHDDIRWLRCDIKTVNLLAQTLLNQKAKDLGFDDVIFVRDGFVTESSYANVFILDQGNKLITKLANNLILNGITRRKFLNIAKELGFAIEERDFSVEEMILAKEVFLTSSSLILRPVSKVDNHFIGRDGKNRNVCAILKDAYQKFIDNHI